jgi:hypothetical protein
LLIQQCAGTVKKLSLELGGNAPFFVFDDADIDMAREVDANASREEFERAFKRVTLPKLFALTSSIRRNCSGVERRATRRPRGMHISVSVSGRCNVEGILVRILHGQDAHSRAMVRPFDLIPALWGID